MKEQHVVEFPPNPDGADLFDLWVNLISAFELGADFVIDLSGATIHCSINHNGVDVTYNINKDVFYGFGGFAFALEKKLQ